MQISWPFFSFPARVTLDVISKDCKTISICTIITCTTIVLYTIMEVVFALALLLEHEW